MRHLALVCVVSACGGHIQRTHLGGGVAAVSARGSVPIAGGAFRLPAGSPGRYDVALRFDVPRAQVVEWSVSCPGDTTTGIVGEPFEVYRERRIAELRAKREQQRENVAAFTGALIGGFVPDAHAHAQVGAVHVDAHASPSAMAGDAIANAAISDDVRLPPGDVGKARLATTARLYASGDGACVVTALADDADVVGHFEITRVRDLAEEARMRAQLAADQAREIRVQLAAQLVAQGAIEGHGEAEALGIGGYVEIDHEGQCRAHAYEKREELTAYLVTLGAHERPPMPPPREEDSGPLPFDGAVWIAGHWIWNDTDWEWVAGAWSDEHDIKAGQEPGRFSGNEGSPPTGVHLGGGIGFGLGVGTTEHRTVVRDHRREEKEKKSTPTTKVRDHRH